MNQLAARKVLILILVAFVALSTIYSVVVPPFEASDELWHYPMVKYIADNWSLPVQDPENVGPWRQEGSQPPLYYALSALTTCWIDTSDMSDVRHLNRHVDNGIATPDGNVNLVVHRPEREAFPWRGTVLAVHVARFLSIAMATVGVALTYFIVREAFPGRRALALGATAIHAFTPMVVFIAGSVNNDNLVVPMSSLGLLMLLRLLRPSCTEPETTPRRTIAQYLPLGIILGLAALTKASSLALTVLTALVVTVRAVRRRSESPIAAWREFIIGGVATLLPLLAISGWWYLRNQRLYDDPSGLNAFIEILGEREIPASLAQLWRERHSFLAGYWGNFGGLNVPMSPWVYRVLNGSLIVAGLGLLVALTRALIHAVEARSGDVELASSAAERNAARHSTYVQKAPSRSLTFVVCVLWGIGVVIPWAQWARVTWSSQGRLIFAALPVWSMLIALGLSAWLPSRLRLFPQVYVLPLVTSLALFLLGLSAAAPFVWIRPAYAAPETLSDAEIQGIPRPTSVDFDDAMRLLGYDLKDEKAGPGGRVAVTLYWEAIAPTEEDYTVFVHLLDKHELVIAQRDTLPGLGLLSTTWLDSGRRWADRYVIPIPSTAYSPNEAEIEVGLFNTRTGERMTAVDASVPPVILEDDRNADNVRFGQVHIQTPEVELSNPITINFGGRMLLSGYDLTQRAAQPGETITLTLHWEALQAMENNYTVSAQLIDAAQRKVAQHDSWPLDGAAPTSAWRTGEVVTDEIPLNIFHDAAPGSYGVRIAVYLHRQGNIEHLPVTPADGRMQTSHITLTQVRVRP